MIYKSKINNQVTYESSVVGSYKYVTLLYKGLRVAPEHKPIKSVRKAIQSADQSLTTWNIHQSISEMLMKAYNAKYTDNERN